jgi:poly(hydroxyalkanoate) depolymerase family esterase
MSPIDWRDLYASNRAAIAAARGAPAAAPPAALPQHGLLPASPAPLLSRAKVAGAHRRRGEPLVHVPAGIDRATAVPLVCMLHGCTQDPAGFAAATRMNAAADRHGFAVVYPGQDRADNAQGCWNWFLPAHQERGRGEPAAIARTVREVMGGEQRIDAGRIFVAGLSSGGAMAAILAFTHPDLVAAFAVHSGLAYGAAATVADAFAAMSRGGEDPTLHGAAAHAAMGERARAVPGMVIHGTADRTVAPVCGEQVLAQSMTANRLAAPERCGHHPDRPSETERGRVDGGHAFTRARWTDRGGRLMHESLTVDGLGHAWSGGAAGGSHTDPRGPDASEAIWRFFAASAAG